ncbi:hypothetical protein LTR42_004225 [Elasticomyces elasticus]|nr:hypothetical protein LTR42_004225 [Elasticomyces elasticus]
MADEHVGHYEIDSEAESLDLSPVNPPTHLQLLFNNSLLDSQDVREQAPRRLRHHKSSDPRVPRARSALQGLMACEEDTPVLAARAAEWVMWANSIAPLVFIPRTRNEFVLADVQARVPDAEPTTIAAVLMITALTIHMTPQTPLHGQLSDASAYSRTVSDAIETHIVNDDFFAGSLEGIEICLLFQRLHFAHARFQKVWLSLRRTIALAEIIGLPRASGAPSKGRSVTSGWTRNGHTREEAGALLWQAACTMERLAGCMFGLSITTKMDPSPTARPVFSGPYLVPEAYFCRLADIAGKIPALDDLYARGQPPIQVRDMVLKIDGEFQELASRAPRSWWNMHPNQDKITPDLVFQYFHQYFTARAHLQPALNNDGSNIYAYSHMVCTEACRNVAVRYATLRPLVLGGFFPVRLFDVQALTAAVFLLCTCHRPGISPEMEAARTPPSQVLVWQIIDSMDSASEAIAGQFAQEAARTIRSLFTLLSSDSATDDRSISLTVPLLGRIHVKRQDANPRPAKSWAGSSAVLPQMIGTHNVVSVPLLRSGTTDAMPPSTVVNDPDSWWMEIDEVLPFLTDDFYAPDQWQILGDHNTGGLGFEYV